MKYKKFVPAFLRNVLGSISRTNELVQGNAEVTGTKKNVPTETGHSCCNHSM